VTSHTALVCPPRTRRSLTGVPRRPGHPLSTYNAEPALARRISTHYPRAEDEARTLLAEIFTAPADLHLHGEELHVTIHPLSAPRRTRALAGLCTDLTATRTTYRPAEGHITSNSWALGGRAGGSPRRAGYVGSAAVGDLAHGGFVHPMDKGDFSIRSQ
jgi:hypothetical protein